MTTTPTKTALHELILARLLAAPARGLTRGELIRSLRPFGDHRFGDAAWRDAIDRAVGVLEAAGALVRQPLRLTSQGEHEALAVFGLAERPARVTWRIVKSRYLPAHALGLTVPSANAPPADLDRLRAVVLARAHGLPHDPSPSVKRVANALAWQKIGVASDRKFTLKAVLARLVLGRDDEGNVKDMAKVMQLLTAQAVGARNTRAEELYGAILRRWVAPEAPALAAPPAEAGPAFNVAGFAEAVREAARATPGGRFGSNKVFIAHVWRTLQQSGALRGMEVDEFKCRLAEANQAGLLRLSRADLVEAMDPDDVRTSEVNHLNASFHFVQLAEGRPHGN